MFAILPGNTNKRTTVVPAEQFSSYNMSFGFGRGIKRLMTI